MPARDVADQLFLCRSYPTAFLSTPKCGSTFVKHLFWQIDTGAPHQTADGIGTEIHRFDSQLPRGDRVTLDWVTASEHAFCIIREPIDRILSLYWDKMHSNRDPAWRWFRERLSRVEGFVEVPESAADHAGNCLIMVDFIRANLRGETDVRLNNHWRPQQMRINMARTIRLKALTLDGLEDQLFVLLGDLIPDLRVHMARVASRNVVPRPIPRAALMTEPLTKSINKLYWPDAAAWRAAKAAWDGVDMSRPNAAGVARLDPTYV
ncbi:MAG: sulfotransferase family 2 domain-containing protein [Pseudomonadota bacterium]